MLQYVDIEKRQKANTPARVTTRATPEQLDFGQTFPFSFQAEHWGTAAAFHDCWSLRNFLRLKWILSWIFLNLFSQTMLLSKSEKWIESICAKQEGQIMIMVIISVRVLSHLLLPHGNSSGESQLVTLRLTKIYR